MGFFSWDCRGCGCSIKSPRGLPDDLAWQNNAVGVFPDGAVRAGGYDGYGGLLPDPPDGTRRVLARRVALWHRRCWEEAGSPKSYDGPSSDAEDQGYFYGEDDVVLEA